MRYSCYELVHNVGYQRKLQGMTEQQPRTTRSSRTRTPRTPSLMQEDLSRRYRTPLGQKPGMEYRTSCPDVNSGVSERERSYFQEGSSSAPATNSSPPISGRTPSYTSGCSVPSISRERRSCMLSSHVERLGRELSRRYREASLQYREEPPPEAPHVHLRVELFRT